MKKTLLIAALASAALVSCSKVQVVEQQQDEIKFSVVAENATKVAAGAEATTTNTIDNFKVFGLTGTPEALYMSEVFERTSPSTQWAALNTKHYWPTSAMNFYAVSPSNTTGVADNGQIITDFVADGNIDLLYAVKLNQTKQDGNPDVALNFRHALSQIVFQAKNTNEKLGVAINGVTVKNVLSKNTLTLSAATANTDDNLFSDTSAETETSTKWGTWGSATALINYEAKVTGDADLETTDNTVVLTTSNQGLLLMPQDLTPWDPSTDASNSSNGSYFVISCKLWNKVAEDSEENGSVYLHGGASEYAEVAIPTTDINWQQGKKYIYTFIFGDGGGYETPDEGGEPVLVPIKLALTVDDFQSVTEIGTTM